MTLLYSKQQPNTDVLPQVWVFVWLSYVCLLLSSDLGRVLQESKGGGLQWASTINQDKSK